MNVPFNRPFFNGDEINALKAVIQSRSIGGGGAYTAMAENWLQERLGVKRALLTTSCTAALEMAVILSGIGQGDEVIMPSFTISSMANAVVLRGGVPVFVDIRPDTLCLDERLIEEAISPHTRAIMPMHYAGIACEMREIRELAARHQLTVIEDAAHAFFSSYQGTPCGRLGDIATFSFHETKNIVSGEGGALVINREDLIDRAEVLLNLGTNRSRFKRGEVERYEWLDIGSSYLPSELTAACLVTQFGQADHITTCRRAIWGQYHDGLAPFEAQGLIKRAALPNHRQHNGHIYYILMPTKEARQDLSQALAEKGIDTRTHYVPLHNAPAGRRYCRTAGTMGVTNAASERLLRLPIWVGLEPELDWIIDEVGSVLAQMR